jgi:predicted transcriptional regulator
MSNKTISIGIPEEMLPQLDAAARRERRTRSGLISDVLRRYLASGRGRLIPVTDALPDEIEAIQRGRSEFKRGEFVALEDVQRELGLQTR